MRGVGNVITDLMRDVRVRGVSDAITDLRKMERTMVCPWKKYIRCSLSCSRDEADDDRSLLVDEEEEEEEEEEEGARWEASSVPSKDARCLACS